MPLRGKPPAVSSDYTALLNRVRKTLVEGQARIEQERVRTYWETGRIIHAHILQSKRAEYGAEVVKRLANDLSVDTTILKRCIRFAQMYPRLPIGAARHKFTWTHYREHITVSDDKKRVSLENAALKNAWSTDELALRIKEHKTHSVETGFKPVSTQNPVSTKQSIPTKSIDNKPLTPLRGELYTYKLVERPNLSPGVESSLLVDLGFGIFHEPADHRQLAAFNKDQIIVSHAKEDAYKFSKTDRTAKDLFTYAAYVEKVIDGDTIKVRLDLGFNVWTRQTLRLRGLDCPEVGTPDGDETKTFVRSLLKESQMIIVRSSVSDKYDRYLADIFIPQPPTPNPQTDIYLNNLLLETGRAGRM